MIQLLMHIVLLTLDKILVYPMVDRTNYTTFIFTTSVLKPDLYVIFTFYPLHHANSLDSLAQATSR